MGEELDNYRQFPQYRTGHFKPVNESAIDAKGMKVSRAELIATIKRLTCALHRQEEKSLLHIEHNEELIEQARERRAEKDEAEKLLFVLQYYELDAIPKLQSMQNAILRAQLRRQSSDCSDEERATIDAELAKCSAVLNEYAAIGENNG